MVDLLFTEFDFHCIIDILKPKKYFQILIQKPVCGRYPTISITIIVCYQKKSHPNKHFQKRWLIDFSWVKKTSLKLFDRIASLPRTSTIYIRIGKCGKRQFLFFYSVIQIYLIFRPTHQQLRTTCLKHLCRQFTQCKSIYSTTNRPPTNYFSNNTKIVSIDVLIFLVYSIISKCCDNFQF